MVPLLVLLLPVALVMLVPLNTVCLLLTAGPYSEFGTQ